MKREPDIARLLDKRSRLKMLPVRRRPKLVALRYLAGKFEDGRDYSEREVTEVLKAWHTFDDPTVLRRELCDAGMLSRLADGSRYWKTGEGPAA